MPVETDVLLTSAPEHLALETRKWWCEVQENWVLEDHHIRLLTLAAECWDRGVEAREILDREGLTYQDRFRQPKSRPEVSIERYCRLQFARLVRELGLDLEQPADRKHRPPDARKLGVGT